MGSAQKVILFVFLVILSLVSASKGSCWRYGHSCWGGHGKRAGPPPAHGTTSRLHPKIAAGFRPDPELVLVDTGYHPSAGSDYESQEEQADNGGEEVEVYVAETRNMIDNDLSTKEEQLSPEEDSRPQTKDLDGRESNYVSDEGDSRLTAAGFELSKRVPRAEEAPETVRSLRKNPQRRNLILYKVKLERERK